MESNLSEIFFFMHVVIKNVTNIMEFGLIGNWINMELIANTR